MSKNFKQLIDEAREIKLSPSEKADAKNQLILFVQKRASIDVRTAGLERLHSRRSILANIKLTFIKPMPIFIAILILLGGGTSFAAEQSLPGDALYPVKVYVNEEVRGWATLSNEAKANWDADLATRRLNEAEQLAAETRLDAETRAQLEANFQAHADRVQARINAFEDRDADKAARVSSNFETSLRVHENILLSIGTAKDAVTEPETRSLAVRVRTEAQESKQDTDEGNSRVSVHADVQVAAEGRMNAAENKRAEARRFIDNKQSQLGAVATTQAEARLKIAEDLLIQGRAKLTAKMYGEAFVLFGKAHSNAQEAKLLVQAKLNFERQESSRFSPSPSVSATVIPSTSSLIQSFGSVELHGSPVRGSGRIRIELGL